MARKDYKLIAEVLFEAGISWEATEIIAEEFAKRLKKENPRFDEIKFIHACLGE